MRPRGGSLQRMNDNQMKRALQSYSFWEHMTGGEQELFTQHTQTRHYHQGEIIHSPEARCEGVLMVLKGELRPYLLSEEGREVTLYRTRAGEVCILSASCVLSAISFDVFIEAAEDTDVLMTDTVTFRALTEENIYVRCYGYEQASQRFSDVMWSMQQLLFMSTDRRIASYLLDRCEETGSATIRETQQEIASGAGTAREVVSRMLKNFEEDGLVKTSRGRVKILDPDKLRDSLQL
jgi:CRP/FNR family transcriptional regulator